MGLSLLRQMEHVRRDWGISVSEITNAPYDGEGLAGLHLDEIPLTWQNAPFKGLDHIYLSHKNEGEICVAPAIAVDPQFYHLLGRNFIRGFRFGVFEVGDTVELLAEVARSPSWSETTLTVEFHPGVRRFWESDDDTAPDPAPEFAPIYRVATTVRV